MMKAEYKRDMNHNYLILYQEEPVDTASYQVRMLVGNVIPSVLKCRMQGVDGQLMVYYDITSRQPLASLFEDKKLNHEDLRLVFGGFIQVMEEMSGKTGAAAGIHVCGSGKKRIILLLFAWV